MADNNIIFTKEDFDSIYLRDEIELMLVEIINSIRNTSNPINTQLQGILSELDTLLQYRNYGNQETRINKMYQIYKRVQTISLMLRNLIAEKINIETYDTINYAIYVAGQRYMIQDLRPEWLGLNAKGLYIKAGKVKTSIDKELLDMEKDIANEIRIQFQQHYQLYLDAIQGMYKGESFGEHGSKLNRGHVAEAYERHLQEHYVDGYQLLNTLDTGDINENLLERFYALQLDPSGKTWESYEDPTSAWIHIRHSMGQQRGTVAGDVGNIQVKQIKDRSGNRDLVTLANLKQGIDTYSKLTNPAIPATQVAHEVAVYLQEVIQASNMDKQLQMDIANRALASGIQHLAKERYITI